MSDCEEEGPYTTAQEATDILRATGCLGCGHGLDKVPPNQDLLVFLYLSTSTGKLANRIMLLLGCKNIVFGWIQFYPDKEFNLPHTVLALAACVASTFALAILAMI